MHLLRIQAPIQDIAPLNYDCSPTRGQAGPHQIALYSSQRRGICGANNLLQLAPDIAIDASKLLARFAAHPLPSALCQLRTRRTRSPSLHAQSAEHRGCGQLDRITHHPESLGNTATGHARSQLRTRMHAATQQTQCRLRKCCTGSVPTQAPRRRHAHQNATHWALRCTHRTPTTALDCSRQRRGGSLSQDSSSAGQFTRARLAGRTTPLFRARARQRCVSGRRAQIRTAPLCVSENTNASMLSPSSTA